MKTQHTPGPWKCQPAPKHQRAIDRKWEIVADCNGGGQLVIVGEHTGIDCLREADARLIAAAPTLLSAAKGALAALTQNKTFPADIALARSTLKGAIQQATQS